MITATDRVLKAIEQSPISLTSMAIKEMNITHPAYVRKILTSLHRAGKVKRAKATDTSGVRGKIPYVYYVREKDEGFGGASTSSLQIVVGDYTLTVAQARTLYSQLKELFAN